MKVLLLGSILINAQYLLTAALPMAQSDGGEGMTSALSNNATILAVPSSNATAIGITAPEQLDNMEGEEVELTESEQDQLNDLFGGRDESVATEEQEEGEEAEGEEGAEEEADGEEEADAETEADPEGFEGEPIFSMESFQGTPIYIH